MNDTIGGGKTRFTGYAFMIATGTDCKDYIKAIPHGTRCKLRDVDLNQTIDVSVSNVPHVQPNPNFPGFLFIEDEEIWNNHPTILLDNPDYHIAFREI